MFIFSCLFTNSFNIELFSNLKSFQIWKVFFKGLNYISGCRSLVYGMWSKTMVNICICCSGGHIAISPPRGTPSCFERICPIVLAFSETVLGVLCRVFGCAVVAATMSWIFFTLGQSRGSHGAGSSEEGGWGHAVMFLFDRSCHMPEAMCDTQHCHDGGWLTAHFKTHLLSAVHDGLHWTS